MIIVYLQRSRTLRACLTCQTPITKGSPYYLYHNNKARCYDCGPPTRAQASRSAFRRIYRWLERPNLARLTRAIEKTQRWYESSPFVKAPDREARLLLLAHLRQLLPYLDQVRQALEAFEPYQVRQVNPLAPRAKPGPKPLATPAQVAQVLALKQAGQSDRAVAKVMGLSHSTVNRLSHV